MRLHWSIVKCKSRFNCEQNFKRWKRPTPLSKHWFFSAEEYNKHNKLKILQIDNQFIFDTFIHDMSPFLWTKISIISAIKCCNLKHITVPAQMDGKRRVQGYHGNPLLRTCQPICQRKTHHVDWLLIHE